MNNAGLSVEQTVWRPATSKQLEGIKARQSDNDINVSKGVEVEPDDQPDYSFQKSVSSNSSEVRTQRRWNSYEENEMDWTLYVDSVEATSAVRQSDHDDDDES